MKQLYKWIIIVQDEYLQTCGLQAIKQCVLRSKTYVPGLRKLLKEYKKSPVPEKQEVNTCNTLHKMGFHSTHHFIQVCQKLLDIIEDARFEQQLRETDLTLSSTKVRQAVWNRICLEHSLDCKF